MCNGRLSLNVITGSLARPIRKLWSGTSPPTANATTSNTSYTGTRGLSQTSISPLGLLTSSPRVLLTALFTAGTLELLPDL